MKNWRPFSTEVKSFCRNADRSIIIFRATSWGNIYSFNKFVRTNDRPVKPLTLGKCIVSLYIFYFTKDGQLQFVTRLIMFEVYSLFWPELIEHTTTFSKKLLHNCSVCTDATGNRCQHVEHTRLGFETLLGSIVTVQTTQPQCLLWVFLVLFFSINFCENTLFIHLKLCRYTQNIPTALWGWVK